MTAFPRERASWTWSANDAVRHARSPPATASPRQTLFVKRLPRGALAGRQLVAALRGQTAGRAAQKRYNAVQW
jgi:hypothetical protein